MADKNPFSKVALASSIFASALLMGCGSDDSSSSPTTPFDSGTVVVPEAAAPTPELITVQVQGEGTVASGDAISEDGGMVGQVVCSAGSPASECMARQGTTLYAVHPGFAWVGTAG